MPYQFRQTGAEIQDILDQVGENTTDIAQNAQDISTLNSNLTQKFTSGTWTPVVVNATTTQATGRWWKIGDVVFLHIHLWFSTTQTNRGPIYINESSLPSVAQGLSISGTGGTGSYSYFLATAANSNIWISVEGSGRTNATNAAYNGTSPQFAAFAVARG